MIIPAPTTVRLLLFTALALSGFARGDDGKPLPGQIQFFENKVRPLLVKNCHRCHGEKRQRGKLRLDSMASILQGGESGPALVRGKPEQSLMIKAVNYRGLEMPPSKKLAAGDVKILTQWVKIGAPWPDSGTVALVPRKGGLKITEKDRQYWAFQPVRMPLLPEVRSTTWAQTPIDAFVLRQLEEKGLKPSPRALRRELIRRAYFDLIGLPPSPEEMAQFLNDPSPDAYPRLIERLLASPAYGERWGRHWLDVVRYAQTNGYERDDEKPHAWRYRNYVVRAWNADKPYDQFVREQIAGDELDPVTDDSLAATAFYRLGVWDDEPDDARQAEFDHLDDIVSTTSTAFLGLTVGCARCHDHKFDPIAQTDYYSLLAFVRNVQPYVKPGKNATKTIFAPLKKGGLTLAVHERGPIAPKTHVLTRGDAGLPGKEVQPRFVEVLCSSKDATVPKLPVKPIHGRSTGRRLALAQWLTIPENPLPGRVIVNRLWHHHFGRGIVATPSDFGKTGMAPTHPKLLDYLAFKLVQDNWSLKKMHRRIMTSATYCQSSRVSQREGVAIDPGNRLLWRQNLRRLQAEVIRDSMLKVSGRLNRTMGGRGIFPTLAPEVLATQSRPGNGWGKSSMQEQSRRSIYIFVKRTLGVPFLETFDFASPDSPIAARSTTTIAPQALILLNSRFTQEQSQAFADRLLRAEAKDRERQVDLAFQLAFQRSPTAKEMRLVLRQFASWIRSDKPSSHREALVSLARALFNSNEMVYID